MEKELKIKPKYFTTTRKKLDRDPEKIIRIKRRKLEGDNEQTFNNL